MEEKIVYFSEKGPVNTEKTLEIALSCCEKRNIRKLVVASSTGDTAFKAQERAGEGQGIIAVTYGAGSRFAAAIEQFKKNEDLLRQKGIRIVRGLHALSGVERSFESKYKTGFLPLNIMADTLRMFSQGVKVCVEVSVMALEAGFVLPGEQVVAVGGTGKGADTAMVLTPGPAAGIFDTRIGALLCMPA